MKRLLVGMLVVCMVLGFGSLALAQSGKVSVDQWFANHVLEMKNGEEVKFEAPARLTGLSGEVSITDKLGVAGSFLFGKSEDFKNTNGHGELSSINLAIQYEVIPMVKARGGFLIGSYTGWDNEKYEMTGITIGAAVDAEVGDSIGIFGEATYAPLVNAKLDEADLKDSSMMAFEAGGTYSFGEIAVKGGYRYQGFDFKAENSKDKESTFSGFFVGVGLSF